MRKACLVMLFVPVILSLAQIPFSPVPPVNIPFQLGTSTTISASDIVFPPYGSEWKIYWDGWEGYMNLFPNGTGHIETSDRKYYRLRYFILKNPQDNVEGMTGPGYTGRSSNLGHRIIFFVDFANTPNNPQDDQRFDGYIFTQTIKASNSRKAMAGITWWNGIPFGFYATFSSVILY